MSLYHNFDDYLFEHDSYCPLCGAKLGNQVDQQQPILRTTNTWTINDQTIEYRPVMSRAPKSEINRFMEGSIYIIIYILFLFIVIPGLLQWVLS